MNEFVQDMIGISTLNQSGSSIALNETADEIDVGSNEGFSSERLTELLTAKPGTEKDRDVLKLMAAAMQIASENGTMKTPSESPLNTAFTTVNTTTQINVSYLVDEGEISEQQAEETLLDQSTANAGVAIDLVFSRPVLAKGMNVVLDIVSKAFPSVSVVTKIAKFVTPFIASYVIGKYKSRIKEAAKSAPKWVHNVINRTVNTGRTAKATAQNIGKRLASLFS